MNMCLFPIGISTSKCWNIKSVSHINYVSQSISWNNSMMDHSRLNDRSFNLGWLNKTRTQSVLDVRTIRKWRKNSFSSGSKFFSDSIQYNSFIVILPSYYLSAHHTKNWNKQLKHGDNDYSSKLRPLKPMVHAQRLESSTLIFGL